ncbi:MAG: PKD domain-containing protein [Lewinellaceae bacterium]|nr:PKD domain-containing protein [Saprospiraceae bacterium]MCB9329791.1 PKD domain-containing protein [Lewinellaceae bacterium]
MRITLTLLTLLQTAFLVAQTADITTGCAPLEVKFTPPAGAMSYFWTFNDGGTSNLASPSNIFTTPGTYDVEFRTSPADPVLGTVTVTVYPKPEVGITAVPESGCIPLSVLFTDTTQLAGDIQVTMRSWVFGDGFNGIGISPNHIFNSVGNFTVSLELTTNYSTCNVTQVFTDKIRTGVKPNVNFTTIPTPPVACTPPLNVLFTNITTGGSGSLTYQWSLGNGNTSNLVDPPAQTYTQNGTFTVTLVATDAIGCSASTTRQVVIGQPTADFVVDDTLCLSEPVLLNNTSSVGSYSWNFGPNAIPLGSTLKNPVVSFSTPGQQTITLTVTTAGNCSSTVTKTIIVDQANAAFTVSPMYSCGDPTIFNFTATSPFASAWEWTFSDSSTADVKNPTFEWTTPDTTGYTSLGLWLDTVYLKVTNPSGCMDEFFLVDSIWRPNARFIPNKQHGCAPLTVMFADSSISNEPIVEWTWLFDDGTAPLVNNTNDPPTHTFTQPGEYNVLLVIRNSAGCVDTSYAILIEVGEPIAGDFTADKFEVCPGESVQFTNLTNDPRVDAWHFSSESDRLWHCFQDENPVWHYNSEAGPMDVSLTTEYNGCFFTVTKDDFVLVKGPVAQLHYKTTCDNTLEFEFTDESYDATQLTWYLGDGDSSLLSSFVHTYAMPGAYTVILKAENPGSGCPISYDTATVYPTILQADFELPDTICGGTPQLLDATKSLGVNAICFKGYTWYFSFQRPIRTDKDTMEFLFGPSGLQTVWLEVEDINGCKDTLQQDLVIHNRTPEITVDKDTICIPSTVMFTDLSTADLPIVSWEWDFGDGNTSTDQNPTHTYTTQPPNGQFFEVKLEIRDAFDCPGYANLNVYVYKPVSNILTLPQPPNICAGESISFTATDYTTHGSNLSWSWNFGNGQTSTAQGFSATYPNAGQYTVNVEFTEIATGCKGTNTATVNVQGYPNASFTSNVDDLSIICYPQNMTLTNTSTAGSTLSYSWSLSNGLTSTQKDISTVFPKGTYTVTLVATTPFGCSSTATKSYTVVGPEGSFEMDKNVICKDDVITFSLKDTISVSSWSWSFGDGTTSNNVNPVAHAFTFRPPSNTTLVKLVLRGEDDACAITVEMPVNFSPVKADFQATAGACAGSSVVFTNTSTQADLSSWSFGDGSTSQLLNPDHIFNETGSYIVKLVVTDLPLGCVDSVLKTINIAGLDLEMFGDTTICPGDTVMIGLESPVLQNATYIWSPTNTILNPKDEAIVDVVPIQTTTYTLKVIDEDGCQDEGTVTVNIPVGYTGTQDLDTLVAKGSMVELVVTPDPNYAFTWTPQQPGPDSDPFTTPALDSSVTYVLTVSDTFGCTERQFIFNIRVVPEDVYAPNAFTPDNDGNNDVFYLLADGDEELVQVLTLRIYSRWGELVYEGTGPLPTTGWDGRINGKNAPSDVYVWVAEVEFITGKREIHKGDLTLLR